MKLNRCDLIDIVAEEAYLSKRDAKAALDCLIDTIEEAIINDQEINISGFGTFSPLTKKERLGTDPSTHKQIKLKSKKTISFKPSKQLKEKLNK